MPFIRILLSIVLIIKITLGDGGHDMKDISSGPTTLLHDKLFLSPSKSKNTPTLTRVPRNILRYSNNNVGNNLVNSNNLPYINLLNSLANNNVENSRNTLVNNNAANALNCNLGSLLNTLANKNVENNRNFVANNNAANALNVNLGRISTNSNPNGNDNYLNLANVNIATLLSNSNLNTANSNNLANPIANVNSANLNAANVNLAALLANSNFNNDNYANMIVNRNFGENTIPKANTQIQSTAVNSMSMAPFNLGLFTITSGSPSNQGFGISVVSDNLEVGGSIKVKGQMPFMGTVNVNGNLPTEGTAFVSNQSSNNNNCLANIQTNGVY